MRAWQVHRHGEPPQALRLVDLELPEPGRGEVRIAVKAAGIGLPDVFMCRGMYPLTPKLPFVAGQEVAGVVAAIGADVEVPVGTRVMCTTSFTDGRGGFADYTIAPARNLFSVSSSMSDVDAASFHIAYQTGWIGLVQRGRLQPGEHLLVLGGSGGSGAAAIQLGRAVGAHVIATAGGPERAAFCKDQGAEVVIDHRSEAVRDVLREATGGHGADVVYDTVGGDLAGEAVRAIANEGRLLLVGFASGSWAAINPEHCVRRNYSVVGVYAGAYDRAFNERTHASLLELFDQGRIGTVVTRTAAFEELPRALDDLSRRAVLGRSVLLV